MSWKEGRKRVGCGVEGRERVSLPCESPMMPTRLRGGAQRSRLFSR